mgnify:CR=1 FL=1
MLRASPHYPSLYWQYFCIVTEPTGCRLQRPLYSARHTQGNWIDRKLPRHRGPDRLGSCTPPRTLDTTIAESSSDCCSPADKVRELNPMPSPWRCFSVPGLCSFPPARRTFPVCPPLTAVRGGIHVSVVPALFPRRAFLELGGFVSPIKPMVSIPKSHVQQIFPKCGTQFTCD